MKNILIFIILLAFLNASCTPLFLHSYPVGVAKIYKESSKK